MLENGKSSPSRKSAAACCVGIGPGNYRLVGWDMDATGKLLVDEICQIAGCTPNSSYSQYVMPYRDLNPIAIKRHNMRVVTIGKFRVLKDSKTNKVLKTKSEVSALTDFLAWLEYVKGEDGVILVYHEPRKVIPAMLFESLTKYNLLDRFKQTVKGFANGFHIAEAKCTNTVPAYSLRTLSKTLLNQEKQLDSARDRAHLAYQLVQHLSSLESGTGLEVSGSGDSDSALESTVEFVRPFVQPVDVEEQEYAEHKVIFERQNNLRPIFQVLFRERRRDRQHATPLRWLLAEAGIEYSQLQDAWTEGKRTGLEKLINEKLPSAEKTTVDDLLAVLEGHFDPESKPRALMSATGIKKDIKTEQEAKINDDRENNNKCDSGNESPNTTISSSPLKISADNTAETVAIEATVTA